MNLWPCGGQSRELCASIESRDAGAEHSMGGYVRFDATLCAERPDLSLCLSHIPCCHHGRPERIGSGPVNYPPLAPMPPHPRHGPGNTPLPPLSPTL